MHLLQADPSFNAARDLHGLMVRAEESAAGVIEFGPGTPAAQAALVAVRARYMESAGEHCARLTVEGRQFLMFAREVCGARSELDLVEILQRLLLLQEQLMVVEAVKMESRGRALHDRLDHIRRFLALGRWQYVADQGFVKSADLAAAEAATLSTSALH